MDAFGAIVEVLAEVEPKYRLFLQKYPDLFAFLIHFIVSIVLFFPLMVACAFAMVIDIFYGFYESFLEYKNK